MCSSDAELERWLDAMEDDNEFEPGEAHGLVFLENEDIPLIPKRKMIGRPTNKLHFFISYTYQNRPVLYSAPPIPAGIHRNPQEWDWNPQE